MRGVSMAGFGLRRFCILILAAGVVSACAAAPPPSTGATSQPAPASAPGQTATRPAPTTAPAPPRAPAALVEPLPEFFESDDFVVVLAKAGDTPESLAQRHLGDAAKAWMIEDYNGAASFTAGRE